MTKKCVWCFKHYAIPKRGKYLCSVCEKAYQTDKYCYDKGLRMKEHRNKISIEEYLGNSDIKIGIERKKANKIVQEMITPNLMAIYPCLKRLRHRLTPYKLWKFLYDNNIWLDVKTAKKFIKIFTGWRYIHAICPRVLDPWNFNNRGIEECYYSNNVCYRTILSRKYPSGKLTRERDVRSLNHYTVPSSSKLFKCLQII